MKKLKFAWSGHSRTVCSLLFLMLVTTSCEKEPLTAPNNVPEAPEIEQVVSDAALNEGMTKLGKQPLFC